MKFSYVIPLILVFPLVACGGGGSSDNKAVEVFPLKSAVIEYNSKVLSEPFTISGTIMGAQVSGSGTVSQSGLSTAMFENQQVQKQQVAFTAALNNNVQFGFNQSEYYSLTGIAVGYENSDEYVVASSSTEFPVSTQIGDNNQVGVFDVYTDASKTQKLGTQTLSYVVERESYNTALLRIINVEYNLQNVTVSNTISTFRLSEDGHLKKLHESSVSAVGTYTVNY